MPDTVPDDCRQVAEQLAVALEDVIYLTDELARIEHQVARPPGDFEIFMDYRAVVESIRASLARNTVVRASKATRARNGLLVARQVPHGL